MYIWNYKEEVNNEENLITIKKKGQIGKNHP